MEEDLDWLLDRLREAWPTTRIILRTDSGFCREKIMATCERGEGVDYVLGLAKNRRLEKEIEIEMAAAVIEAGEKGQAARQFWEFRYSTLKSWSRERRVIGKAEALPPPEGGGKAKENPRFVVTSLPAETHPARVLYEHLYCARGEAENRVKEHKLGLFSARCSSNLFGANTLRFYLSTFAMILFRGLREALHGTRLAVASADRIRLRLLKIGGAGPDVGATHPHRHVVGVSRSRPVSPRLGTSGRHLTPSLPRRVPEPRERAARNTFEGPSRGRAGRAPEAVARFPPRPDLSDPLYARSRTPGRLIGPRSGGSMRSPG